MLTKPIPGGLAASPAATGRIAQFAIRLRRLDQSHKRALEFMDRWPAQRRGVVTFLTGIGRGFALAAARLVAGGWWLEATTGKGYSLPGTSSPPGRTKPLRIAPEPPAPVWTRSRAVLARLRPANRPGEKKTAAHPRRGSKEHCGRAQCVNPSLPPHCHSAETSTPSNDADFGLSMMKFQPEAGDVTVIVSTLPACSDAMS